MANNDILILGFALLIFSGLGLVAQPFNNLLQIFTGLEMEKLSFILIMGVLSGIASLVIGFRSSEKT